MVHTVVPREQWPWDVPTPRILELLRQAAELVLRSPPEWLDEFDRTSLEQTPTAHISEDPVLLAAIRRTNRATLFEWATANVRDPGAPVEPTFGPDSLLLARDMVRRGLSDLALTGYRVGQNLAWLRWMELVFGLTSEPDELRALLDISARSISWFIDATLDGIRVRMEAEREELTRGTQHERREVISLLLAGAPIASQTASQRLGYRLDQYHRAAVIWSEEAESDLGALESVGEAFVRATSEQRPLMLVASAATLWVWVGGKRELTESALRALLQARPGVRIAVGGTGRGVEGFRRSHLDALAAQRMLGRLGSSERVVSYDAVRLVALATQDAEAARSFVRHVLGELATDAVELREALRVFLREGSNASRAAQLLRTHRNTLLRRLARAEELLPRPLDENRLDVAVALEILRWQ